MDNYFNTLYRVWCFHKKIIYLLNFLRIMIVTGLPSYYNFFIVLREVTFSTKTLSWCCQYCSHRSEEQKSPCLTCSIKIIDKSSYLQGCLGPKWWPTPPLLCLTSCSSFYGYLLFSCLIKCTFYKIRVLKMAIFTYFLD